MTRDNLDRDWTTMKAPVVLVTSALTVAILLDYLDFRFKAEDWRKDHPKLAAWHKTFAERASLKKTLPHD